MGVAILVVVAIGVCVALAYAYAGVRAWTAGLVGLGALASVSGALPGWLVAIGWLGLGLAAAVLNVPRLRRRLVGAPGLRAYRRIAPRMSDTEREAIEAGTVWWDAELFGGRPDWDRLLAIPAPRLSDEEQAFLDGPVEELCGMLDEWHVAEERRDLPPAVWSFMKTRGLFGMIIPKEFGGLGFSALAHSAVVVKLASRSGSAAVTAMVPNSLGPAELLLHYGTDEQKRHYLPRLARGDEIPCFALTGPEAGSDAGAMPDVGVVCRGEFRGERDVLGIRLDWEKRYITLGPVATLLGLAFKLHDPDRLLGDDPRPGITLALIPTDTPGIEIGNRHLPLAQGFQNGPNTGRGVFIPVDWIIGGPAMAGRGWRMLMESLAAGRSISLPALATGSAKVASRATGAYAAVRKQFGTPVGQFEGVQEALARIGGSTYAMESARVMTAGAIDLGERPSVVSAIAKYHLTEGMRRVLNDAMDVHGGRGICMGPRNYLARGYMGIPIAITVEGANILTRSLIIFGQGAIRCHPYVLREMHAAALADEAEAVAAFDAAIGGHVAHVLGAAARSLVHGLTGARLARAPASGTVGWYYRQIARLSAALALSADAAMILLGGRLKRLERLSARLGDVLSHLYLASAALKRFEDHGRAQADRPLLHWACRDALFSAQGALDELFSNLPVRWAAPILRALVFPLGLPYGPPNDANDRRVARLLLRPSPARDRLTDGIYIGGAGDPIGRVEHALLRAVEAEGAARKVQRALRSGRLPDDPPAALIEAALAAGVVDADEAGLLRAAEAARLEAIRVDDFAPEALRGTRPAAASPSAAPIGG